MPWFEYEGVCPNGTAIAGRIEAAGHEHAQRMLNETMQVTLSDLRAAKSPPARAPISDEDFIFFNEQLASLASAGMALDQGLQQIARDVASPRLRRLIEDIAMEIRRGVPLEQAIAKYEPQMPLLYSRVIRAGVQSGQLSATLLSLNQHLRIMGETRRLLWETLSYPLLVLGLAFGLATFFALIVGPKFKEIFRDFGTQLPLVTKCMLGLSDALPMILATLGIALAAGAVVWLLLRTTPGGRAVREAMVAGVPVVGRVYKASLIARFIRSVATCINAGVTLPEALRLAGGVTGSPRLITESSRVAEAAERGDSVFNATQLCGWIPAMFGYTIQAALGRQNLPTALMELSKAYEQRATHIQSMLRVLLFPALVCVVGLIIMMGIVALFLPLVTLINSVSGPA